TGANAGTVDVSNSGAIETNGANSMGVAAESIGGGGGVGGAVVDFTLTRANPNDAIDFNVRGSGGTGGDGNTVTATNTGLIFTTGTGSVGLLADSIGGGGGNGGIVMDATFGTSGTGSSHRFAFNIGGSGGDGGTGGNVTVNNTHLD